MKYEGIVEIGNEAYHAEKKHISSSNLKSLLKDPAIFYKEKVLGQRKEFSPTTLNAFAEGTLAHTLILEPHMYDKEFDVFPGIRKQGKEWEDFKKARVNSSKVLISKSQKIKVEKWVKSFRDLKCAVDLVKGGFSEHTLFGELMQVPIKVRADYINVDKGYIADVKTTSGFTDLDSFKYTISSFEYGLSAALYLMMFEQHYGKPFDFYFIVLGKRDFTCEVYKLSKSTRMDGESKVIKALREYKKCKKSGIWTSAKVDDIINSDGYEILEV